MSRSPRRLFHLSLVSALLLAPAAPLHAQAGLSGNALGGQAEEMRSSNSAWDKGLNSQSALGQLEELSGGTVDRSATQSSQYRAPAPKRVPTAQGNFNTMMRQQVASTVVESLLSNLLADDSADQAQAQAEAAAAAEAARQEAERQAEAARLAREEFARNLRAAWDAQDEATSDNLSGAFEVGRGTAFFGLGGAPDAAGLGAIDAGLAADAAPPVDLPDRDNIAVNPAALAMPTVGGVGLTTGPAIVAPAVGGRWVRPDEQELGSRNLELVPRSAAEEAALHAAGWYADTLKEAATDSLTSLFFGKYLQRLEELPGMDTAKAFLDFKEKYEEISSPIQTDVGELQDLFFGGSLQAASVLGSSRLSDGGLADSYNASVDALGGGMGREFRGMAFKEAAGKTVDAPDFGPAEEGPLEHPDVVPLLGVDRGLHGFIHIHP